MTADTATQPRGAPATVRILHCIDTLDPAIGGPAYYVRVALAALAGNGYVASLATLDGTTAPDLSAPGEAVERHRRRGWFGLYDAMRRADVVHVHGFFSMFACTACVLCRILGKPFVISVHGQLGAWCLSQGRRKKALFLSAIGRPLLRTARAVVALSAAEALDLERWVPKANIRVAGPAVTPAPVRPANGAAGAPLRVLFLGRLHPVKRVEMLILALARLRQAQDATLDIAGEGDREYAAKLEAVVMDCGLSRAVRFHGSVQGERKRALFQACDVFVLPSAHENFAVAAAEAMAHGVPVILSEEVAISGEVARAGAGIRLAGTSAASIAEALQALAPSAQRARMGAAARAFVEERYSPWALSNALAQAYGPAPLALSN